MKRIIFAAISISMMSFLASCGVPGNGSSTCTANVNGSISIYVQKISQNSYSMQLCSASNGDLINVYGGNSSNAVSALTLTSNSTPPRKSMVDNFIQAGATIQVDFYSTDSYFSVYPVVFYNGSYVTDFNHPLIISQQLPF